MPSIRAGLYGRPQWLRKGGDVGIATGGDEMTMQQYQIQARQLYSVETELQNFFNGELYVFDMIDLRFVYPHLLTTEIALYIVC